jgi:hypothetical protein
MHIMELQVALFGFSMRTAHIKPNNRGNGSLQNNIDVAMLLATNKGRVPWDKV